MPALPMLLKRLAAEIAARQTEGPGAEVPHGDPNEGVAENIRLIIFVSVFSIVLAGGATIARLIFRKTSKMPWLADDYLIIVAAIITSADAACYLACLPFGFGQHMWAVDPALLLTFFKIVFATFILYGAAVSFVKFSVLAFYARIFPRNNFKWWLISLGVASGAWWILITLASVLQCNPVQKNWDDSLPGYCINYLDLYIAIQVLNIVLDIAILALPISTVMKLQMGRANKISVAMTFALGGLSVIFAIIRLGILIQNQDQTDITFGTATAVWSLLEPAFETFVACLPAMTPLVKAGRYLVQKTGTLYGSSKGSSRGKLSSGDSKESRPGRPQYIASATVGSQYEVLPDNGSGYNVKKPGVVVTSTVTSTVTRDGYY